MRAREFTAWFVAILLVFATLFMGAVYLQEKPPVVKKVTVKKLELPVKYGPGDLIKATGRLKPESSQFYVDQEAGMLVQCDQYANAKKASKTTVAFQVCYFDVTPPQSKGRPELSG